MPLTFMFAGVVVVVVAAVFLVSISLHIDCVTLHHLFTFRSKHLYDFENALKLHNHIHNTIQSELIEENRYYWWF